MGGSQYLVMYVGGHFKLAGSLPDGSLNGHGDAGHPIDLGEDGYQHPVGATVQNTNDTNRRMVPNTWIHRVGSNEPGVSSGADVHSDPKPPWGTGNRSNGRYPVTQYQWRIAGPLLTKAQEFHAAVVGDSSIDKV